MFKELTNVNASVKANLFLNVNPLRMPLRQFPLGQDIPLRGRNRLKGMLYRGAKKKKKKM